MAAFVEINLFRHAKMDGLTDLWKKEEDKKRLG